jgi:hypothetical protein
MDSGLTDVDTVVDDAVVDDAVVDDTVVDDTVVDDTVVEECAYGKILRKEEKSNFFVGTQVLRQNIVIISYKKNRDARESFRGSQKILYGTSARCMLETCKALMKDKAEEPIHARILYRKYLTS